jgi:hypothetical protein
MKFEYPRVVIKSEESKSETKRIVTTKGLTTKSVRNFTNTKLLFEVLRRRYVQKTFGGVNEIA